ncbi:condensation domain-containing protein [Methanolobus sp. ZRKC2]|uniref:condensation domain-containing protein n=1 Tax=Methanolobus sp. ZRKC2 TaxID=3125783 RepID=UPI003244BBC8
MNNNSRNTFKKEIRGMPRLLLRMPNSNVLMFGSIKGDFSADDLKKAVRKLPDNHQFLKCRIKFDNDDNAFYTIDRTLILPVINAESCDMKEVVKNELKYLFDFEKEPLVRITLVKENKETFLVVNCHHTICDGMSLVYLFKDIMQNLANRNNEEKYIPSEPVFFEQKNVSQKEGNFFTHLFSGIINWKWKRKHVAFSRETYRSIHHGFWNEHMPEMCCFSFSEKQSQEIISKCREHGIKVNTALTTALLQTEKMVLEDEEYSDKVTIAVNIRDSLTKKPEESIGYFATAIRPQLKYSGDKAFLENALIFQKEISKMLSGNLFKSLAINLIDTKFLDSIVLNKFGKRNDKMARKFIKKTMMDEINTTFTVSNLGLLEIPTEYGPLELKTLYGPIIYSDTMEKYIGILTINGKIHLSICYDENIIGTGSINKIKNILNSKTTFQL